MTLIELPRARSLSNTLLVLITCVACALGPMIAAAWAPSTIVLNQVGAMAAWGLWAAMVCWRFRAAVTSLGSAGPVLAALVMLVIAAMASVAMNQLPFSMALTNAGLLCAAILFLMIGVAARQLGVAAHLMSHLCIGWVVLGGLAALVCTAQVFLPDMIDGDWIANSDIPGRAIGNMRQPNHTAVFLVWAVISLVWLLEAGRLHRVVASLLMGWFSFAVLLTASRTGLLGLGLVFLWGLFDRRLTRSARSLVLMVPVAVMLGWLALLGWQQLGAGASLGATARVAEGAVSTSRFAIWSDAVTLILRSPWIGVGWGEFNLAWSLSPFPHRPSALFDNVHNLPLQLMVELGVPIGLVVLCLLGWAVVRAIRSASSTPGPEGASLKAALMMLALVAVHSLLELPLWYVYFLLPTALMLGVCLGATPSRSKLAKALPKLELKILSLLSVFLVAVSAASLVDYLRVTAIFTPSQVPLEHRITRAQQSLIFGPVADYSYAAHFPLSPEALVAARRASHHIVDGRLLMVWATALNQSGDVDRARFLVDRLKEFNPPIAHEWLAQCEKVAQPPLRPFQCTAASKVYDYRDFR